MTRYQTNPRILRTSSTLLRLAALVAAMLVSTTSAPALQSVSALANAPTSSTNRLSISSGGSLCHDILGITLLWPLAIDNRANLGRDYANYVWSTSPPETFRYHSGLDIAAPIGSTTDPVPESIVRAAASGFVVLIQENDTSCLDNTCCQDHGYGNTIILQHTFGADTLYTQYSHLNEVLPSLVSACGPSDSLSTASCPHHGFRHICQNPVWVDAGAPIAYVGASAFGQNGQFNSHLHFELKDNGWLAATGNDSGPFSYSDINPDSYPYCYHDPLLAIDSVVALTSPMSVTASASDVLARVGPGGSGSHKYRAIGTLDPTANPYSVVATAGPTTVPQCSEWYYLRRSGWTGECTPNVTQVAEDFSCFPDPAQNAFNTPPNARLVGAWSCRDLLTPVSGAFGLALSATPTSGPSPFSTTATAVVNGGDGTINYTLWWDCNALGNSVSNVMSQCGFIPTPSPGTCSSSSAGVKCNALLATQHSEAHVYGVADLGVHTIKVIAERGSSVPAEARLAVYVDCPPFAAPVLVFPVDGASGISTAPLLQWQSVDGAAGYDIEVCRDAGCSTVERAIRVSTPQWNVDPPLANSSTYYWRVSAFSAQCGNGPWSDGSAFLPSTTSYARSLKAVSFAPVGMFTTAFAGNPDLALFCSPNGLAAPAGGGDGTTCSVTSIDGFSAAVALSAQGLPPGLSASSTNWTLHPQPGGSQSTAIGINVAPGTLGGTYPFQIQAVSGSIIHTFDLSMVVSDGPDFSIACNPEALVGTVGETVSTTCTVESLRGFSGDVALSDFGTTSGLLSQFDPQVVSVPSAGVATASLALTIGPSVTPGAYSITVQGTSDAQDHASGVTLLVNVAPDFTLTCSPTGLSTVPGGAATASCTVWPVGGFNSTVSLTCQPTVPWITCTPEPSTVSVSSGAAGFILTVAASSSTATGYAYPFSVTGTSGSLSHSFSSSLSVTVAPDFRLSCSPTSPSAAPGSTANTSCTVRSLGGFDGPVSLACLDLIAGAGCSFSPPTLTPPVDDVATTALSITLPAGLTPGTYPFTVSGANGNISHSEPLNLNVLGSGALWARTYQGQDLINAVASLADGGGALAGSRLLDGGAGQEAFVWRLDPQGNVLWKRTYSGPGTIVEIYGIAPAGTGFIVVGRASNEDPACGDVDLWIALLDSTGALISQKTLGVCGLSSIAWAVTPTADGGFLVVGDSPAIGAGTNDAWVIKLDAMAGVEWQRAYGGPGPDRPLDVRQTADGGYVVVGYTASFGAGGIDAWVIKLDASGNLQWQSAYGAEGTDLAYGIEQLSDGSYLVGAHTFGSFGGGALRWVLHLDASGGVVWQESLRNSNNNGVDGSREKFSATHGTGDAIVMAGDSALLGTGAQVWLTELDASGEIRWQHLYEHGSAVGVARTTAGGLLVGARADTVTNGSDTLALSLSGAGEILSCAEISDTSVVVSPTDGLRTVTNALTTATSVVPVATTVVASSAAATAVTETCNSTDPSFRVSCSPDALASTLGGTAVSSCAVSSLGGFSEAVTLSCEGLPPGISCSFGSVIVVPSAAAPATTSLNVVVSSGAVPGSYPFRIVGTSGAQQHGADARVTIPSPSVSSVIPSEGSSAGGTEIVVLGVNFLPGMSLTLGGAIADPVTVISPTQAIAQTPAHSAGSVTVQVTNPDGQVARLLNGFTYFDPTSVIFADGFENGTTAAWSSTVP